MFWINLIGFQLCWAACVWGGANGHWWLGPAAVLGFVGWEMYRSARPSRTLALVFMAAAIGFGVDSAYVQADLLRYASPVPWSAWAPVWIVAMWISFSLTLNESLAWLKRSNAAAVALGAIGGPFAYWVASASWDAAEFIAPQPLVLAIIGAVWAVATPLLLRLADRVDPRVIPAIEEAS